MRGLLLIPVLFPVLCIGQVCFDKELLPEIAQREAHPAMTKAGDGPDRGYDLNYHRLELTVDPAIRAISGSVTHYFTALEDLSTLDLDLAGSLIVSQEINTALMVSKAVRAIRLRLTPSAPK